MRAAFYDFDGTLVSSNVVSRYFWYCRQVRNPIEMIHRCSTVLLGIPYWLWLDSRSRRRFNETFYLLYRGLELDWLQKRARLLLAEEVIPKTFPGAAALIEADRAAGYEPVLVTGGLDFAMKPAAEHLGFDHLIANRMEFKDGIATGNIIEPLLAEEGKVKAIEDFVDRYNVDLSQSKAYSDSGSDAPMLEMAGQPAAVNPDKALAAVAAKRGWPILDTKHASTPNR